LEIRVRRFYAKHKDEIDISVINEKITKMITQTRSAIDTLANDIAGLENITTHNLLLLASDKYEPEFVQLIDYYFQSDDQCDNGSEVVGEYKKLKCWVKKNNNTPSYNDLQKLNDIELCSKLAPEFPNLTHFLGSVLAIYGSTARVESDFSIIKNAKDAKQQRMSFLNLTGIMHMKQWHLMDSCMKTLKLPNLIDLNLSLDHENIDDDTEDELEEEIIELPQLFASDISDPTTCSDIQPPRNNVDDVNNDKIVEI
jgi:hypothetical protein